MLAAEFVLLTKYFIIWIQHCKSRWMRCQDSRALCRSRPNFKHDNWTLQYSGMHIVIPCWLFFIILGRDMFVSTWTISARNRGNVWGMDLWKMCERIVSTASYADQCMQPSFTISFFLKLVLKFTMTPSLAMTTKSRESEKFQIGRASCRERV